MNMTRKDFLRRLLHGAAGVAGAAIGVACSSNSSSSGPDPMNPDAALPPPDGGPAPDAAHATSCTMNGTISTIGANHGHVLVVSKADVAAGTARTYDIRGTAGHTHSVTVTAAMFTQLKGNTTITTTSSVDAGHAHSITVMCA